MIPSVFATGRLLAVLVLALPLGVACRERTSASITGSTSTARSTNASASAAPPSPNTFPSVRVKSQCYQWHEGGEPGVPDDNLVVFASVPMNYSYPPTQGEKERRKESRRELWKVTCDPRGACTGIQQNLGSWDLGEEARPTDIFALKGRVVSRTQKNWVLEFGVGTRTVLTVDLDAGYLSVMVGAFGIEGKGEATCPDPFAWIDAKPPKRPVGTVDL
jgi:hypothetical protein